MRLVHGHSLYKEYYGTCIAMSSNTLYAISVILGNLKYLNLRKCPYIDDWCLDRMAQFRDSLLVLDLSECPMVTERGLSSLHRLKYVHFSFE